MIAPILYAGLCLMAAEEAPPKTLLVRKLPASVDLRRAFRRWGLNQRQQGARGTCSVFAVVGGLEYAVARKRRKGQALSVEFLNWAGHRAVGRSVDGGFFSELWKGFEIYGICPEDSLPYRPAFDPALEPSGEAQGQARQLMALGLRWRWIKAWNPETGLSDAEWQALKEMLARRRPVCGGFRWPKQPRWEKNVLQMCGPDEVFDGHSVLLVGYRDDPKQPGGGVVYIRDSGGHWPEGLLPYAYVRQYINDAGWIGGEREK
ncbi:MAG: hypothetical protein IT210_19870 [Armatimonadetes bacterium]|nr:hypothetical protein [Armatimonadota bacterium]